MANITRRPDGKWRARYRDAAHKEHARHFDRKIDAQRWLDSVTTAVNTGAYVDPRLARVTVGDLAPSWLDGQVHLAPSTASVSGHNLRRHVLPRWGSLRLADIAHSDVQAWVSQLNSTLAPETVRKIYRVLSLILTSAVRDGRLAKNPCDKIKLPRRVPREQLYLSHAQVRQLADGCGDYRVVVLLLAYVGLRWGEMAALRVGRLDLPRRRLTVAESVTLVDGAFSWGMPKSYERREVPIPRFVADELAVYVAGKAPEDLVFSGVRNGGVLRVLVFRRAGFNQVAADIGLAGLRPHDLRHTAASLAIASLASIKVVQRMLGHASAAVTLDRYGHLYPDDLDDVADRLHDAAETSRASSADFLRTND